MIAILVALILILFNPHLSSYQQTPSKELTFCLTKATTSNSLKTFWRDANTRDCDLDALRLLEQYTKLKRDDVKSNDRCALLMIHQMRKQLINLASQQLEEAIVMQALKDSNQDVTRLLENIHNLDKRISRAVWDKTLSEILTFVDETDIIESILQIQREDLHLFAFQLTMEKINLNGVQNKDKIRRITYKLSQIINNNKFTAPSIERIRAVYNQLPSELRFLYDSSAIKPLGLLNRQHWEYLYAPRMLGPDSNRRFPLTWSKEKNFTEPDGRFYVVFNAIGSVAIGSVIGATPKYLYADIEENAPYFWIGSGRKSTQWWNVIWFDDVTKSSEAPLIVLQNDETKDFLCATEPYDVTRRYAQLLRIQDYANLPQCQWWITEL